MARVKKASRQGTSISMYLMLLPYLILLVMFGIVPVIMAIREVPAPSRVNPDGGWDAFKIVSQDFRFIPAIEHVLQFMAVFVPLTLIFVIGMALMLDIKHSKWSIDYVLQSYQMDRSRMLLRHRLQGQLPGMYCRTLPHVGRSRGRAATCDPLGGDAERRPRGRQLHLSRGPAL